MILIDGNNQYIKLYSQMQHLEVNGRPVGGLFGFIRSVLYLIKKFDDNNLIVVWDGKNGKEHRRAVYSDYKKGRTYSQDGNLWTLKAELQEILQCCMGVKQAVADNYEADDVIAYFAKNTDDTVVIVSSDKDFWQLLSNKVCILSQNKIVDVAVLKEETGCNSPEEYLLCKVLAGDSSDNIKGVERVGLKTALKIIRSGSADKYKDIIDRNLVLMKLSGDIERLRITDGYRDLDKFMRICVEKYQFKSLTELVVEIFDRL